MSTIHATRWIEYFVAAGVDVHVVNVGLEEHDRIESVTYHDIDRVPSGGGVVTQFFRGYRPFRQAMSRLLATLEPDLVHVHGISIYAYIVRRSGGRRIMATAWGSEVLIDPNTSWKYRLFVRRALRAATMITCDADHIKDRMTSLGARRDSIELVYFGTDIEKFSPEKRDDRLAEELGFPPATRIVLSLRALRPIYDIQTLIRAVPAMVANCSPVAIVIVGDGPERPALEQLAGELGVDRHIRFVGRLDDAALQRFTASADVYVSTALSDAGLAASTAEAMACAVPPVVSDFGNNRDWIEPGATGHLFSLRDHDALSRKVCDLLTDRDSARAMGERARDVIATRNNWKLEMGKVMDLYQRLSEHSA